MYPIAFASSLLLPFYPKMGSAGAF